MPSWSGVTMFTFGGPSTTLHPHSALEDGTETSLQWEMLREYTHFCLQYIIINASKHSNLFHSLKRKKNGNCNLSASSLYFFSVKIRKVGVSVHHQATPHGIITWPIQCHWTSLWRWTNDHYISAPAFFLNPNLFSWTWDCWFKTLFSAYLSSSLLKTQAFPRLSFLSLCLFPWWSYLLLGFQLSLQCGLFSNLSPFLPASLSSRPTFPVTWWIFSFHRR